MNKYTANQKTQALDLFLIGWSHTAIAKYMDIPSSTIYGWVKSHKRRFPVRSPM